MNTENDLPISQLVKPAKKLTDWKNEPTVAILKEDLMAAKPSHDTQIARINQWLDLLNVEGSAKPKKIEGHSTVQPKLIRRQAEWRYSALSEPFLNQYKLFTVNPKTFEDEAAAKQNELLLNWQFNMKLNKIKLIDDYVRSVVDEGTCIVKLGWNRVTKTRKEMVPIWQYFAIQDEQNAQVLQQAAQMKQMDPRSYDEQVPDEIKSAVDYLEETGIPTQATKAGEEETEVEDIIENDPVVDILNPANVYIDPSCNGDISKALFIIHSFETNKAELKKYGSRYKNLDSVNWDSAKPDTDPDHITSIPDTFNFADTLRKKVVAYEYWGFYDINKDGNLVPIVATWINDVMIRMEENPFPDEKLPFVLVPYNPIRRGLYGEPDAELLDDNQRILGAVTRGMIDLMGRSANAQQGFAKGMLDALNRKRFDRGDTYEFNPSMNPANGGYIEHKYPEIPQSAILMVQMQNQEAEALTGVKAFSGGLAGDAYNTKVATAIRGVIDAAGRREMAILRRLAKGMVDIGNKIIAMNGAFLSEEEVIRITNRQYVTVKREDLKGNFDLEVDIATTDVDNEKAQDMGFMLQTIGPNMGPDITLMILAEIADLKRMPALAEKLRTYQPQPDPVAEQAKQLELQKLQMEVAKLQAEVAKIQADAGLKGAQAEIQATQAQASQTKTDAEVNKMVAEADLKQAQADNERLAYILNATGTQHQHDMEKMRAQAQGNQNLEVTKALLKSRKPEESEPDIEAAIGYNSISEQLAKQNNPDTSI